MVRIQYSSSSDGIMRERKVWHMAPGAGRIGVWVAPEG